MQRQRVRKEPTWQVRGDGERLGLAEIGSEGKGRQQLLRIHKGKHSDYWESTHICVNKTSQYKRRGTSWDKYRTACERRHNRALC